jgi:hypothetical protein
MPEYEKLNLIKLRPKFKNDNFFKEFEKEMKKIQNILMKKWKKSYRIHNLKSLCKTQGI